MAYLSYIFIAVFFLSLSYSNSDQTVGSKQPVQVFARNDLSETMDFNKHSPLSPEDEKVESSVDKIDKVDGKKEVDKKNSSAGVDGSSGCFTRCQEVTAPKGTKLDPIGEPEEEAEEAEENGLTIIPGHPAAFGPWGGRFPAFPYGGPFRRFGGHPFFRGPFRRWRREATSEDGKLYSCKKVCN